MFLMALTVFLAAVAFPCWDLNCNSMFYGKIGIRLLWCKSRQHGRRAKIGHKELLKENQLMLIVKIIQVT